VTKAAGARNLKVCLLSSHPLALREFQTLLADGFDLEIRRIEPNLETGSLPSAAVYLIDALPIRAQTETVIASVLSHFERAHVMVLAEDFGETDTFPLLKLGAKGLLRYADVARDLARATGEVAKGGFWVARAVLSRFVDYILTDGGRKHLASGGTHLSRREQEVIDCLLENLSNKEIASKLNISERTAKFHVSNLLSKYGVRRRADLILLFFQNRIAPAADFMRAGQTV
jgi:DNA-binding NarL/FixJ family response regulator